MTTTHNPYPDQEPVRPPSYVEKALAKCVEIEAHPASYEQTMATLVCSAALRLAQHGGYVDHHINDLHRAADYIVAIGDKFDRNDVDAELGERHRKARAMLDVPRTLAAGVPMYHDPNADAVPVDGIHCGRYVCPAHPITRVPSCAVCLGEHPSARANQVP